MKPIKGLYLDCLPEDQPEGTYRDARNILVSKLSGAVSNEDGLEPIVELTPGSKVIHSMAVGDDRYVIFVIDYAMYPVTYRICIVESDRSVRVIVSSPYFYFSESNSIKSVLVRNFKNELVIAWTDAVNPPRILNLDALPFDQDDVSTDDNKEIRGSDLLVLTELFPRFKMPYAHFDITNDTGGALESGVYFLAFAYELPDMSSTNYSMVYGPFTITGGSVTSDFNLYSGCEPGTVTSKCIELSLTGIDTRYKYLKIAVVKKINGNTSAWYVGRRLIAGTSEQIIYTGIGIEEPLLIEDVLVNTPNYTTAKSLTLLDHRLYLANLTEDPIPNFQKYANNIKINWTTEKVNLASVIGSYKDEVTIFNKRGFFPDEVYAFYIRFNLSNGQVSPAYHIPGRAPGTTVCKGTDAVDYTISETEYISSIANPALGYLKNDELVGTNLRLFHTRETAKSDGTMGYWENANEIYPEGEDWTIHGESGQIGTLERNPVRHHKFPELDMIVSQDSPMIEMTSALGETGGANSALGVIGIIYDNQQENIYDPLTAVENPALTTTVDVEETGVWSTNKYTASIKQTVYITGSYKFYAKRWCGWGTSNAQLGRVTTHFELIVTKVSGERVSAFKDYEADYLPSTTWNEAAIENQSLSKRIDLEAGDSLETYIYYGGTTKVHFQGGTLNLRVSTSSHITEVIPDGGGDPVVVEVGTFGKVFGIKVSDIYIPEEMLDKITGYEILYAKRTTDNMRVVAQAPVFHNQSKHPLYDNEMGPAYGSRVMNTTFGEPVMDDSTARVHAFDLLGTHLATSPSYIKAQALLKTTVSFPNNESYRATADTEEVIDDTTKKQIHYLANFVDGTGSTTIQGYSADKKLRRVTGFKYIPGDTIVPIDGKTLNNTWGEEHAYFAIKHLEDPVTTSTLRSMYAWGAYSGLWDPSAAEISFEEKILICNIYQHLKNVYLDFSEQELAATGKVFQISLSGTQEVQTIFGGDTFLNSYGIRLTAPFWLGPGGLKSETKFQAVKSIYYFPIYSVNNIDLRHAGLEDKDDFFPHTGKLYSSYKKWVRRSADVLNSNSFFYNPDYTSVNDLTKTYPYNSSVEFESKFPFRIVRSKVYLPGTKEMTLHKFLPLDYFEMVKHRGEVTNIEGFDDILFINTMYSLFKTVGKETIETSTTEVTLGTGDIFRMPPTEIIPDKNGYAGCQHITSCLTTKIGYFFVDSQQGKIFLVSDKVSEISNNGMRNYFFENAGISVQGLPETPNRVFGGWYTVAFDEKYNRIILTKKDIRITLPEGVNFYPDPSDAYAGIPALTLSSDSFYMTDSEPVYETTIDPETGEPVQTFLYARTYIRELTPEEKASYIQDRSITMSYSLNMNSWTCWHDYLPGILTSSREEVVSFSDNKMYLHNIDGSPGKFYEGIVHPSYQDVVFNPYPDATKVFSSFDWRTAVIKSNGVRLPLSTFEQVLIRDTVHCSGLITLENKVNTRMVEGEWRFNAFRDMVKDPSLPFMDEDGNLIVTNIDLNKAWSARGRFIDRYVIFRWIENNLDKNTLYLYSIDTNYRQSDR